MRFDKFNTFSWDLEVRTTGGVYSDTLDLGSITNKLSAPNEPWSQVNRFGTAEIIIEITESFTNPTSGGFNVGVNAASDTNFTINFAQLILTPIIHASKLIVGYRFPILKLPAFSQQYIQLRYGVDLGGWGFGKVSAGLVLDRQSNTQGGPLPVIP